MSAYKAHHEKNTKGEWVRKKGHAKNEKGEWTVPGSIVVSGFAGFEDWVPIFMGGKQTDSNGKSHDGDELIEKAVKTFDPQYHEPPAVLGHPEHDKPAYGWVEGLRKVAEDVKGIGKVNVLYAKFKDVVPEFAQAVKDGLFKKRSASFYPDGRLRHVGFLGAMPPAVKGLANLKFAQFDEQASKGGLIAFDELNFTARKDASGLRGILHSLRDYVIGESGVDFADRILTREQIEELTSGVTAVQGKQIEGLTSGVTAVQGNNVTGVHGNVTGVHGNVTAVQGNVTGVQGKQEDKDMPYTEEQVKALLDQQRAAFAEELKKQEERITAALKVQITEEGRKKGIGAFCDSLVREGKVLPAWIDGGLKTFMEHLEGGEPVQFAENRKETPLEWFQRFLQDMPGMVRFDEFANGDNKVFSDDSQALIEKLIKDKQTKNPNMSYAEAFNVVQIEYPAVAEAYMNAVSNQRPAVKTK